MREKYLLDTNICIYIAKNKPQQVLEHFKTLEVGQVTMSVITYGELYSGVQKSQQRENSLKKLSHLTQIIPVLALSDQVGKIYGEIRSKLELNGKIIGNNDLWIAAHAIEQNLILVSNNLKEFNRVSTLTTENWVKNI